MTAQEKKRLSALFCATEFLFLENLALKLVLDYRQFPTGRSCSTDCLRIKRCWLACA